MVSMQLRNCKNCSSLSSLGQLGSLKELSIMGIDGVQKVGQEFYGNIGSSLFKPFEFLEILRNCNKLVANRMEWGLQTLPFLRTLGIEGCEKERFPRSDFCPPLSPPLKLGVFQI
ncbi:hypothetical protein CK203_055942 [Vitis vinifera]|uniref:Disease resistance protein n=1 Tax=Vitis vinifera TaxID=29760 RepID=A0A438GPR1_VITVI|nr:hypothetical protein CK203_055942 [Vitis vinifera]